SRAHVASHIARNADALSNLLDWARTGVEHRMYNSASERAQDISTGSTRSPQEIRTDAIDRARNLASEVSEMTERDWAAPVRTARDRPIAAAEVPFMRVREVWVHAVDLGAGGAAADLPRDVAVALIEDAVTSFSSREPPAAVSVTLDGGGEQFGFSGWVGYRLAEVHGSAQAVAAWLLGRSDGSGLECSGSLPELPAWL
ncbi:MAG: maleylpyruvate isomerase family mycothiol-dependent enzyme, partial [Acidimicrobiales bacterium]